MKQTHYITPQLGPRSASILGLLLIGALALLGEYMLNRRPIQLETESITRSRYSAQMWLTGLVYGIATGGCWLATVLQDRYRRWAIRTCLIVALALLIDRLSPDNWLRDLANLGGLAITQCLLFAWLRLPTWERAQSMDSESAEDRKNFQYGIGDIVISTTCIALLLGIVIRYPAPTEPLWYWAVLLVFWGLGPLTTACIVRATLTRNRSYLGFGLLAILLSALAVIGLSAAELQLSDPSLPALPTTVQVAAFLYGRLVLGYFLTFTLFSIAGRLQGGLTASSR